MGQRIIDALVSSSSGEWTPKLDARVDQQKYRSALRKAVNVIPYKTGGFTRRPGFQYMASAKLANTAGHNYAVRMRHFRFSPTTVFMLEFGNKYVRFYSNGQQVNVTTGSLPYWINVNAYTAGTYVQYMGTAYYCIASIGSTIPPVYNTTPNSDPTHWVAQTVLEQPTPYNADAGSSGPDGLISIYETDIWNLSFCQINDVIYIVSPDYPPYKLTRYSNTDWVMSQVAFDSPALLDQNATDTTLSASATSGSGITLTAAAPAWVPGNYYNIGNSVQVTVASAALVVGQTYVITYVGTTNFVPVGAASNTVGVQFVATGTAVGTGTVTAIYVAQVPNVSTASFANDFAAGYWSEVLTFNALHVGSTWQLSYLNPSSYLELDGTAANGFSSGTTTIGGIGGTSWASLGGSVSAGSFVVGQTYVITAVGTTNFIAIGASGNVVGTIFTATGAGTGTGTANLAFASQGIQCIGSYEVHTYGVWSADIAVQRSLDGGQTWDTVRTSSGRSDRNVDIQGKAAQLGLYRVVLSVPTGVSPVPVNPGATNPRVVFEVVDAYLYGLVQITGVTNNLTATATVVTQLATTGATEFWSEAAWSEYRGYPQAICSFQQRLIYAASGYEPQRIWGTVTNDIENFALGDQTLATDSFAFDLNAPGRGPIQWLTAQLDLFAGFSGAEWVINSGSVNGSGVSTGAAITPTNINATENSTWGSAESVEPVIVGDAVLYTQRQATSLRQMMFSIYTTRYMSNDLTELSDHLFASGIVQLAYMQRWRKQGIVWAVTQQGMLCGMTYELGQEVFGWHKHLTGYGQTDANGNPLTNDNGFESCDVIDGQNGNDDELWAVTNRTIGGSQVRFIERMNPANWEEYFTGAPNPPAPNLSQAFYVDAGITVTSPGSLTISGLSYLNGRYVVGLADGVPFGPSLVAGGQVTLPGSILTAVGTVNVGLPISYAAQPMRIDADPRAGNTQARTKQIADLYVRVWNSLGGSVSNGTTQYATWVSGQTYAAGAYVMSPATGGAYLCQAATSTTTDPGAGPNGWSAGQAYGVGATVNYQGWIYTCSAAVASQTPPPMDAGHWTFTAVYPWILVPTPSYQPPVPIPYPLNPTNPFAQAALITTPTDLYIPNQLKPSPDADPVFIVQGNDALPLTVLAFVFKYDITSTP
jgi:hypothetical protein